MKTYRVEILGRVPNGLSHNEVYATVNSLLRERVGVESVTKRRLSGGMVSIVAKIEADNATEAYRHGEYVGRAVTGFSFDTMVRKCIG